MALYMMIGLVAVTMAIVYLLPRLTRAAPPALVAILGVGLAVYLLGLPTRTLGDMAHIAGGLPSFNLLRTEPEDEHVVRPDPLAHLHVGPIHRADGQLRPVLCA